MNRVPELIDVWFDSGSMPYAQWHYPFENQDEFKEQFPADYICEAVDQTRGWFYSLHAISTLLFDSVAYQECDLPGSDPGCQRAENVKIQGECGFSLGSARKEWCRCNALVSLHCQPSRAGTTLLSPTW